MMTKNKNLQLNNDTIKLGELNFEHAQFHIPEKFKVNFSTHASLKKKEKLFYLLWLPKLHLL